jgi:hypothetical protein|tara:strand:+ start:634 stop:825 length:192 start_codon:yes stop_codon:yes gene_type:complete
VGGAILWLSGDDGKTYSGAGIGTVYGPTFGMGDILAQDFTRRRGKSFYKEWSVAWKGVQNHDC